MAQNETQQQQKAAGDLSQFRGSAEAHMNDIFGQGVLTRLQERNCPLPASEAALEQSIKLAYHLLHRRQVKEIQGADDLYKRASEIAYGTAKAGQLAAPGAVAVTPEDYEALRGIVAGAPDYNTAANLLQYLDQNNS